MRCDLVRVTAAPADRSHTRLQLQTLFLSDLQPDVQEETQTIQAEGRIVRILYPCVTRDRGEHRESVCVPNAEIYQQD